MFGIEWTPAICWVIIGLLLGAAEILVGSFYLLILALGAFATAYSATFEAVSLDAQCMVFSIVVVAGGYLVTKYREKLQKKRSAEAQDYDVGQTVSVTQWGEDGSARVQYRGASWTAVADENCERKSGQFVIVRVDGSRLIIANKK